jgi:hypothetical protein
VDDAEHNYRVEVEKVTEPKRLTDVQAGKKLGVSPTTLANWRARKFGPPYLKIGRKVEYLADDIEAWRLAQRHDPEASWREAQRPEVMASYSTRAEA